MICQKLELVRSMQQKNKLPLPKLTNYFYRDGQKESNHDKVSKRSAECTRDILEVKKQFILKMTNKFEDAFIAPKSYWTLINHPLYNKKIPVILPLLVDWNFVSNFNKKTNLFNNFFASICTPKNNGSNE